MKKMKLTVKFALLAVFLVIGALMIVHGMKVVKLSQLSAMKRVLPVIVGENVDLNRFIAQQSIKNFNCSISVVDTVEFKYFKTQNVYRIVYCNKRTSDTNGFSFGLNERVKDNIWKVYWVDQYMDDVDETKKNSALDLIESVYGKPQIWPSCLSRFKNIMKKEKALSLFYERNDTGMHLRIKTMPNKEYDITVIMYDKHLEKYVKHDLM